MAITSIYQECHRTVNSLFVISKCVMVSVVFFGLTGGADLFESVGHLQVGPVERRVLQLGRHALRVLHGAGQDHVLPAGLQPGVLH